MTTLQTVSVVNAVAASLSEAILNGEYAPGARISEAALSERFGVPRPSIRSALMLVQGQGLVRRLPNRSVFVPQLGADDIADIFATRELIEVEAVRRLVRTGHVPQDTLIAMSVLEGLTDSSDWGLFVEYDFALHRSLVDGAGSPRLSHIYEGISAETRLAISQLRTNYDNPSDMAAEHRRIVSAIQSGDEHLAVETITEHIQTSAALLIDIINGSTRTNIS